MEIKRKTYGEQFNEALLCETPEQAEKWLADEGARIALISDMPIAQGVSIVRQNIAYMAGYYDNKTANKIARLFSPAREEN